MTRTRYLEMQEQMGREARLEDIPPGWEDFPDIVITAVNTFNMLGDRVYPEIGYVGKDYTNVAIYIEIHGVTDKEFFLEIIAWLDSRAIKKAAALMKREYDKLKRKNSGK